MKSSSFSDFFVEHVQVQSCFPEIKAAILMHLLLKFSNYILENIMDKPSFFIFYFLTGSLGQAQFKYHKKNPPGSL